MEDSETKNNEEDKRSLSEFANRLVSLGERLSGLELSTSEDRSTLRMMQSQLIELSESVHNAIFKVMPQSGSLPQIDELIKEKEIAVAVDALRRKGLAADAAAVGEGAQVTASEGGDAQNALTAQRMSAVGGDLRVLDHGDT